jgi:hypothetical protein
MELPLETKPVYIPPIEEYPLYREGDITSTLDAGGNRILMNPNREGWFLKRAYRGLDPATVEADERAAIFDHLPYITRLRLKKHPLFEAEKSLYVLYSWLKGRTQTELATEIGSSAAGLSRRIALLGQTVSRQFTIIELITGDLPEPEVPETPPVETPEERYLARSREFLKITFGDQPLLTELPDETVRQLLGWVPTIAGRLGGKRSSHASLLTRWLEGESYGSMAREAGVSTQAVYSARASLSKALTQVITPETLQQLRAAADADETSRILDSIQVPSNRPKSSYASNDRPKVSHAKKVKKSAAGTRKTPAKIEDKRIYKSDMTSAEFWKSPIPKAKPTANKSYKVKKEKVPLEVKETRPEIRDGKVFEVKVLEGYNVTQPTVVEVKPRIKGRREKTVLSIVG